MVIQFKDRALASTGRELSNTVRLLAHHFDTQLEDFQVPQREFAAWIKESDITSPADFSMVAGNENVHRMLKRKANESSAISLDQRFRR